MGVVGICDLDYRFANSDTGIGGECGEKLAPPSGRNQSGERPASNRSAAEDVASEAKRDVSVGTVAWRRDPLAEEDAS